MKIEMKINEISSNVLSKVKSQLSFPLKNLKRILRIIKRFGRNFHNGLYGSLPGFAVKELSHCDGSFEYPQHMFCLKK